MTLREKTCCFTGHRYLPKTMVPVLQLHLKQQIEALAIRGFTAFLCGGALGLDLLAAEAVLALRGSLPEIKLVMTLPCPEQAERWQAAEQARYHAVLRQADEVLYTSDSYTPGCMQKRNRYMVDRSSACLFYITKMQSGTAMTLKYAIAQDLELINLLY